MNLMLKAQMLATSLDVYFSDPTLGGNKISAPVPIGKVDIDLSKICVGSCSGSFIDARSGFGIVAPLTSVTVSYLLNYAASQSNATGSTWYGNVKSIQELAKDTFDAVNNELAFSASTTSNSISQFIGMPVSSPRAITAGVPTLVTVSSFIPGAVIPGSVNLFQIDAADNVLANLGPLNDTAGDQIFTGQFTFSVATPGSIQLQVSAAFPGLPNSVSSVPAVLEVLPTGVPVGPAQLQNSQIVTDTNGRQMLCNQVLAYFQPGTDVATINRLASGIGGQVVGFLPGRLVHTWQIQIPCTTAQGVVNAVSTILANPVVFTAEPNFVNASLGVTPNDPLFSCVPGFTTCDGPYLLQIRADRAWAITTGLGPNLQAPPPLIAFVDTGIDYTHEDLSAKVWSAPQSFRAGQVTCPAGSHGFNFVSNTCDPMDDNGHGTAVAGVAGADSNNGIGVTGVSWTSPLMAVKVLDSSGTSDTLTPSAGISFAVDNGAKIINASFGCSSTSSTLCSQTAYLVAVDYAASAGRLVVAGAGNDFCSQPFYPAGLAATPTVTINGKTFNALVLSVGGVDLRYNIFGLSNATQCTPNTGSNFGPWVNVYAPWDAYSTSAHNSRISSNPGGYDFFSGTSLATPYVSGTAALVWAANPQLSAADVKNTILAGGVAIFGNLDPLGNQVKVLDAFNAIFKAAAQSCAACPQAPEVVIEAASTSVGVGMPRGVNDTQNVSVHGISIPLAPISSSNAAAAFTPPYYQVIFINGFNSWDSYACCSPRPGGWFDSFSVSTSAAPYWEMGLQDPLPQLYPLAVLQSGCPVASASSLIPYFNCPFVASFVIGGSAAGTFSQSVGAQFIVAPGQALLGGAFGGKGLGVTWLNLVLDTATQPDADNLFPSWGFFQILDITPMCGVTNSNPNTPIPPLVPESTPCTPTP
jgi:hypothetical protein